MRHASYLLGHQSDLRLKTSDVKTVVWTAKELLSSPGVLPAIFNFPQAIDDTDPILYPIEAASYLPGELSFVISITREELRKAMFARLRLPRLPQRPADIQKSTRVSVKDVGPVGRLPTLDKRRSVLMALKRNARIGKKGFDGFESSDLRYRKVDLEPIVCPPLLPNPLLIILIDTSDALAHSDCHGVNCITYWAEAFLKSQCGYVTVQTFEYDSNARFITAKSTLTKKTSHRSIPSVGYRAVVDELLLPRSRFYRPVYMLHLIGRSFFISDETQAVTCLSKTLLPLVDQFWLIELSQATADHDSFRALIERYRLFKDFSDTYLANRLRLQTYHIVNPAYHTALGCLFPKDRFHP